MYGTLEIIQSLGSELIFMRSSCNLRTPKYVPVHPKMNSNLTFQMNYLLLLKMNVLFPFKMNLTPYPEKMNFLFALNLSCLLPLKMSAPYP